MTPEGIFWYNIWTMEEVIKKLKEHDKIFVSIRKRFDQVDKRFEAVDKRFDQVEQQVDFLARKTLEHGERLERIENKMEFVATKDDISRVINTLDEMVGYYRKKDQELLLFAHGLKKADDRIEVLETDVKKMKPLLGLS